MYLVLISLQIVKNWSELLMLGEDQSNQEEVEACKKQCAN
jgi:hypothetical protein